MNIFAYEDAKRNTKLGNRSTNQKLSSPFLAMTCLLSNFSKLSVSQFSCLLPVIINYLVISFIRVITVVRSGLQAAVVAEETAGADTGEEKSMQFYTGTSLFSSKCNPT